MKVRAAAINSIMKKARLAMKAAVRGVMLEHKEKGLPIYVWQHNKVVRIPARRISTR